MLNNKHPLDILKSASFAAALVPLLDQVSKLRSEQPDIQTENMVNQLDVYFDEFFDRFHDLGFDISICPDIGPQEAIERLGAAASAMGMPAPSVQDKGQVH